MLITTCTHCLARFRVSPQQLNAKQGQVRCGRCRKVFNGFEALERYPDDDTGSRLLAAREAHLKETGPAETSESVPLEENLEALETPSTPEPTPAPAPTPPPPPPPVLPVAPTASVVADSQPLGPPSKPLETKPRRSGPIIYEVERAPAKSTSPAWRYAVALLALVLVIEMVFAGRGDRKSVV